MQVQNTSATATHALKQLNSVPLALEEAIFQHYPAMKLGSLSAIQFYSQQLYTIARTLITQSDEASWLITAPPYYHLPAAANLLAREVHKQLLSDGINTELCEPKLGEQHISFNTQAEFDLYYDYSKNNLQQRIAERQRLQQALEDCPSLSQLDGKSILIINDINVTGTQQQFMQKAFDKFGAKRCEWLYIFNVENTLGTTHPQIEHQINHSGINTTESYISLLNAADTTHTARCVSRLFNESLDNFTFITNSLTTETREQLHTLARAEGRYNGLLFSQKMELLAGNTTHPITQTGT